MSSGADAIVAASTGVSGRPADHKVGPRLHVRRPATSKRSGELEITMLGLLHLFNQHKSSFSTGTAAHLGGIMQSYGGAPRSDPYVQSDGKCLGFGVIETENHILMQETARYLINALRGVSNAANRDWLVRFLQMIVRRDFYEYNALPYTRYHIKALYALHDYAPDPEVATAARGALDWLFTKTALSANFDRDHRSYRRRPEPDRYARIEWWGQTAHHRRARAGSTL